ncbi:hypothetical protein BJV78DRAFT_1163377, partial [Lactifluus subvellereus]
AHHPHIYFAMLPIITLTYVAPLALTPRANCSILDNPLWSSCLMSSHGGRSVMGDSSPTSNMTTIDNYCFHTFDIMGGCNALR